MDGILGSSSGSAAAGLPLRHDITKRNAFIDSELRGGRRHVQPPPSETAGWAILSQGPGGGANETWQLEPAGNAKLLRSAGFTRKRTDWVPSRTAAEDARAAAFYAHDARRQENLASVASCGVDVITGAEVMTSKDPFEARGRAHVTSAPGPLRAVETAIRDREPGVRFFRVAEPSRPGAETRARVLLTERPIESTRTLASSELGFGRRELPSVGVAEAFALAEYGGTRRATYEDYALTSTPTAAAVAAAAAAESSTLGLAGLSRALGGARHPSADFIVNRSGVLDADVWDAGTSVAANAGGPGAGGNVNTRFAIDAHHARRNRIFDTTSRSVITLAVPDPHVRAVRETRELIAARPPRPATLPSDLLGTARTLDALRRAAAHGAEVRAVRALT